MMTVDEAISWLRVNKDDRDTIGRMLSGAYSLVSALAHRSADDTPELQEAVKRLLAHWYDMRGIAMIDGRVQLLPVGVAALIQKARP